MLSQGYLREGRWPTFTEITKMFSQLMGPLWIIKETIHESSSDLSNNSQVDHPLINQGNKCHLNNSSSNMHQPKIISNKYKIKILTLQLNQVSELLTCHHSLSLFNNHHLNICSSQLKFMAVYRPKLNRMFHKFLAAAASSNKPNKCVLNKFHQAAASPCQSKPSKTNSTANELLLI